MLSPHRLRCIRSNSLHSNQCSPLSNQQRRHTTKRSFAINVGHVFGPANVFAISAGRVFPYNLVGSCSRVILHQEFVRGNDTLHLVWITTTIGMKAFRQGAITAFDLLGRRIVRQAEDCQCLLADHQRACRIYGALPQCTRPQTHHIPQECCQRFWRWCTHTSSRSALLKTVPYLYYTIRHSPPK